MTPIEILALVTAIGIIIKSLLLIFKTEAMIKPAQKILKKSETIRIVIVVFAAIIFYFLLQELSIIQIAAVMLFTSLCIKAIILNYKKSASMMLKEAITRVNWVAIVLLIFLALWILYELFY